MDNDISVDGRGVKVLLQRAGTVVFLPAGRGKH
jgi:hypothetical protein